MNPPSRTTPLSHRPPNQPARHFTFFPQTNLTTSLSRIRPQERFLIHMHGFVSILSSDSCTSLVILGTTYCILLHRLLHFSYLLFGDPHLHLCRDCIYNTHSRSRCSSAHVANTHSSRRSANTSRVRHRPFPIRPGGHQFKQGMIYNDQPETFTV